MSAKILPGIVQPTCIGLTAGQLLAAPSAEYTGNPERWEFFDIADITLRYRINNAGAYGAAGGVGGAAWGGVTGTLSAQTDLNIALNTQSDNAQTGTTYTLVLADAGQNVDMNNAAANTLTIPLNAAAAFPIGTMITVTQIGAGATTIAFAGTIQKPAARALIISAQYESASLYKVAADTWRITCN